MKSECNACFLFIAELTGSFVPGSGTVDDKIMCGQANYIGNYLPELNLNDEEDRKDLHEVVWLERLYAELDAYFDISGSHLMRYLALDGDNYREEGFKWSVPLELDASALTTGAL